MGKRKESYTEEELEEQMSLGGFKTGDEVLKNNKFMGIDIGLLNADRQRLLTSIEQLIGLAKTEVNEEQGYKVSVKYGDCEASFEKIPQPRSYSRYSRGGGGSGQESKPKPKLEEIQEIVMEMPDLLNMEHDTVTNTVKLSPVKFLGDQWSGLNTKLRDKGFQWGKEDPNDSKSGRWVGEVVTQ